MSDSTVISNTRLAKQFHALSNQNRLLIMQWLVDPTAHFEPQVDGDLVEDGVCVGRIVDKIELSQPTVTSHMKILADVGLVSAKKIKNWVFYKPEPAALRQLQVGVTALDGKLK
ncbi:ArsR/SmtB family transcription factor [Arenicella xantha]|uniref:ArsR family transcriptional regulator n=1 Tax=Arenicella xantha TaxID=644221 RepID=A0A395JT99_9GAMM|nr:metalloregulator ArsR/SmtB family transcription factor [Arenicella xantha]RBP53716.1 ArsR family transcriptional regulator [Arenicella xantha]